MSKRDQLEGVARQLARSGMALPAIAESLQLDTSTIYRWRNSAPDKWREAEEGSPAADPDLLLQRVGEIMREICESGVDPVAQADALSKITRVYESIWALAHNPTPRLKIIEELLDWGRARLRGQEYELFTGTIRALVDDVEPAYEQGKDLGEYATRQENG